MGVHEMHGIYDIEVYLGDEYCYNLEVHIDDIHGVKEHFEGEYTGELQTFRIDHKKKSFTAKVTYDDTETFGDKPVSMTGTFDGEGETAESTIADSADGEVKWMWYRQAQPGIDDEE